MSDAVERIREHVERERERFAVPGCALVVVRDGEVVLSEGFGRRNDGDPVTSRTLFPIGSSTKTFTAALCASLVDEGLLDLDAPLRELLPGFAMQDPIADRLLSVRDCLAHRSGLPRHDLTWYAFEGRMERPALVDAIRHLPPAQPFRQTWQYNNLLYVAAGFLAGRLCGGTYEEAVRARLLDPLGMTRTSFRVADVEIDADHSRPYVLTDEDTHVEVPYAHLDLSAPAGCINSCAEDLAPWLMTLLGLGVDGRQPLLSDELLRQLRTPTMPLPPGSLGGGSGQVGYGLGVVLEDHRGHRVAHHGGNIDGFSSQVLVVPDAGIGVAVLTNLHATPLRDVLPLVVVDELLGLDPEPHGERRHATWSAMREGAKQAKANEAAGAKPLPEVRPVHDFVGTYAHPGYGELVVERDGDGLRGSYGRLSGPLAHRHLDVYSLVLSVNGDELRIPVQFTADLEADVDGLRIPLEPALPPQRFERRPDTAHLTGEVLDGLAGRYALDALTAVVSRRGEADLLVSVAGGPPRRLTPVRELVFALDGARIEFTDDGRLVTPLGELVRRP
ncbi:MAG: serine hydrolase [Frankiales bacterium]|nr:MAG: serine hydrolase [Frankiales bacterium]